MDTATLPDTARPNTDLIAADRRAQLHPFSALRDQREAEAFLVTGGAGCRLTGPEGRSWLDGAAGLWCVNAGYGQAEITEAIAAQSARLPYFHSFNGAANEPSIRLAERILELAPPGMARVFFGSSGSDANDTAVKLLWTCNALEGRPEKRKVISRRGAYHGVTVAAGSLSGIPVVHKDFGLPLDFARHVSPPDLYRDAPARGCRTEAEYSAALAAELEALIVAEGPETVAGMVMEPVMGTGGVLPPPEGYIAAISEVLRRHDVRLIADEVITGFGRTGAWFASARYGLKPDMILTAKGLTSGYLPLSAVILGEGMFRVLEAASEDGRSFAHGFTYSGHPTAAAAGLANLALIEREGLVERVAALEAPFRAAFDAALGGLPHVGDIRSAGLMLGIELVADRQTKAPFDPARKTAARVALAARERGALVRALPGGDVLALSPPFIVTEEEIAELASILRDAILDVTGGES
ncbi:aspartate aminotransferase family protein [Pseudoroseicyclus sp. CXY001]|uniref:aminotransferase family protein n=1 Tax=Pseudoroseicyclus sp. CXY001 TaxID=3242492 RepID=UPI00358DD3CF